TAINDRGQIVGAGSHNGLNRAFLLSPPRSVALLDPVESKFLAGPSVTPDTDLLASPGIEVTGVSADAITQVVARIAASVAGESFTISVLDEQGQLGTVAANGGVFSIDGTSKDAASTLQVTAVDTLNGPMAFAIYRAPSDFARGPQDFNLGERTVSVQVQASDVPGASSA